MSNPPAGYRWQEPNWMRRDRKCDRCGEELIDSLVWWWVDFSKEMGGMIVHDACVPEEEILEWYLFGYVMDAPFRRGKLS